MKRKEAIALLRELGANQLVNPSSVILEQRTIDKYQLKIKGDYCLQEIETLAKNRFSISENQNFLIIYKS